MYKGPGESAGPDIELRNHPSGADLVPVTGKAIRWAPLYSEMPIGPAESENLSMRVDRFNSK